MSHQILIKAMARNLPEIMETLKDLQKQVIAAESAGECGAARIEIMDLRERLEWLMNECSLDSAGCDPRADCKKKSLYAT